MIETIDGIWQQERMREGLKDAARKRADVLPRTTAGAGNAGTDEGGITMGKKLCRKCNGKPAYADGLCYACYTQEHGAPYKPVKPRRKATERIDCDTLRELTARAGLSLTALAKEAGISTSVIQSIREKRPVIPDVLERILQVLSDHGVVLTTAAQLLKPPPPGPHPDAEIPAAEDVTETRGPTNPGPDAAVTANRAEASPREGIVAEVNPENLIILDFKGHEDLLGQLRRLAAEQFRHPDQQVLYFISWIVSCGIADRVEAVEKVW